MLVVLTFQGLLTHHLVVEVLYLGEEVVHFTSLFVALGLLQHVVLGLVCQVLTLLGHWEHYLLKRPILPNNLTDEKTYAQIFL